MFRLFSIILIAFVLSACQRPAAEESTSPQGSAIENFFSGGPPSASSERIKQEREEQKRKLEQMQKERLESYNQ